MHHSVGVFDPGLDPISFVEPEKETSLVIEFGIVAKDCHFGCEIAFDRPQVGMAAIADETIEGLAPEIRIGVRFKF